MNEKPNEDSVAHRAAAGSPGCVLHIKSDISTHGSIAMKDKKAVRKLGQVEALLSDIIERHSTLDQSAGEHLAAAQSSVSRAKETILAQPLPGKAKKPPVKAEKPTPAPEATKKPAPPRKQTKRGSV